jgi:hypothetical protein
MGWDPFWWNEDFRHLHDKRLSNDLKSLWLAWGEVVCSGRSSTSILSLWDTPGAGMDANWHLSEIVEEEAIGFELVLT